VHRRWSVVTWWMMLTVLCLVVDGGAQERAATYPAKFHSTGVGGGGALYSVSFNPKNPDEIWMPTDMGELFHTLDGGRSWTYPDMEACTAHVDSRVQWTHVEGTIYVHEWNGYPVKSVDGGRTWERLKNWGYFTEGPCKQLRVDPTNAGNVFGCSEKALAFSTDGGATFRRIWEKSRASRLWVSGLFADGKRFWIATTDGLLVSTDGGATWARSAATGLPEDTMISSFAGAKKDNTIRFWVTVVDAKSGDLFAYGPGQSGRYKGFYRMDVGDKRWTNLTPAVPTGHFPVQVAAAADDIDTVWLGGAERVADEKVKDYFMNFPAMLKSADGGKTWESMLQCRGNRNVHTDWYGDGMDYDWAYAGPAMTVSTCASNPDYAAFTNLFCAWATSDGGRTWRSLAAGVDQLNKPGVTGRPNQPHASSLNNTASWWLEWLDEKTIFSGSNDITAFRSTDGGKSWCFPKYIGNRLNATYRAAYDAKKDVLYAAMSNAHDLYHGVNMGDSNVDGWGGAIYYSTDRGATFRELHKFIVRRGGQVGSNPVMGVLLDPKRPNRMYALVAHHAEGGVFRTDDLDKGVAATWVRLTSPPRTEGHPWDIELLKDGTLVVTFAGRINQATGKMTESSGVFVSSNDGQTWEDRTAPAGESSMRVNTQDVVIDPRDPAQNTWYACVDYVVYLPDAWPDPKVGLFKTTDRGRTWKRIFSEIRVGVRSGVINPATNEMYLATIRGLWYSNDSQADAPTFVKVPDVRTPDAKRVFLNPCKPSEVWVLTFGGGVHWGDATENPPAPAGP
ncbi:MAG TPA: hypothetical protein VMX57_05135, partial [Planctomycetota bacterium]|nr:hypothetical protein [Planctomycetota bacterium]